MNHAKPAAGFRLRSPAVAIAWEIWRAQRAAFCTLFGTILLCAGGRCLLPPEGGRYDIIREIFMLVCVLLWGLSLGAVFFLFKFTESDRRERFTGFPARLFILPVRTWTLVTCPMLYGVITVALVYVAWTLLVLQPLHIRAFSHHPGHFRIAVPVLYLATGMMWFQAFVWGLANFRITRLVVLGAWGTLLLSGWAVFSPILAEAQLGTALAEALHVSVGIIQAGFLLAMSSAAYGVALWTMGRQRHGSAFKIARPRLQAFSLRTKRPAPYRSPQAAQSWFEWRRNGRVLPLIVTAILLLIVTPFFLIVPFAGRADADTMLTTLVWMLGLPFMFALIIGQGFGKTDPWSQGLGHGPVLPLFLAVRPLTATDWVAVKLKLAALSAAMTWLIATTIILVWLSACCDLGPAPAIIIGLLQAFPISGSGGVVLVPAALLLLLAMLATWRLLVTNLYFGILGSRHSAMSWFILLTLIPPTILAGWYWGVKRWPFLLDGLPWVLGVLVAVKCSLALGCFLRARKRQLVSAADAWKYFCFWIYATEFLLLMVWLMPTDAATKKILVFLALLALPLFRISLLPLAFAQARVH